MNISKKSRPRNQIYFFRAPDDNCFQGRGDYMTNVIDYDYFPVLHLQLLKIAGNRLRLLTHSAVTITQNNHVFFDCYNINSETHW